MNMSAEIIKKYTVNKNYKFELFDSVDSTNDTARMMAQNGAKDGTVVIAHSQTNGRGTKGRSFFSPKNSGIYMSIILRPDVLPEKVALVTPAAAVAVCEALESVLDCKTEIKWVNDVYYRGKKVCGILTEASFDTSFSRTEYVVLGIGINLFNSKKGFPDEIKNIAGYIADGEVSFDLKARVIGEVLNCFDKYKNASSSVDFIEKYRCRSNIIGRRVNVIKTEKVIQATALKIDDDCRLVVQYDDGEKETLFSGEVSIKI